MRDKGAKKNAAKLVQKALPKQLQRRLSAARLNVLLPRPKRRKREFFVARETGESFREWVQRNLEDSFGCYLVDVVMALLSLFIVVFNAYAYWNDVVGATPQWMIGSCEGMHCCLDRCKQWRLMIAVCTSRR